MRVRVLVIIVVYAISTCNPFQLNVPIGGIFEGTDENEELAFQVAIDLVNRQHRLPFTLVPLIGRIDPDDVEDAKLGSVLDRTWNKPFAALETTCALLKESVVGVFNSLSDNNANAVQSVCDAKGIPVIQTRLNTEHVRECCSINLFPEHSVLATAFADVVKRWNWQSFTIMYENQDSLPKITDMLKIYNTTGHTVVLRQLRTSGIGDFRQVLKDIWRSGQENFVLDSSTENLGEILLQAQQVGLMTNKYKYIIINLDMHTIEMGPYQYGETNITGLRLVDPLNTMVIEAGEALHYKKELFGYDQELLDRYKSSWRLQTRAALMMDAVLLFAETLEEVGPVTPEPIYCNSSNTWIHGETLYNYMKTVTREGLTGTLQFDHFGVRSDFGLDLVELREGGIIKIGNWNSKDGLNISRIPPEPEELDEDSLSNRTFIVEICLTEPYGMRKDTREQLTGNEQFVGFGIDVIDELAKLEKFNYTFLLREDNKNGDYNNVTGEWTGMIGDIIAGTAHLAITDLTINRERQAHVDFTTPFMDLGIKILYAEPVAAPPSFFTFASPFAIDVWILLAGSFMGVSIALFFMARLCYSEWSNPYPCIEEPEYLINQFSFRNSLWFTLGGLMQQGADIAPTGLSTRLLTGFWWFFTLIMVSSYTANLAAFLTSEVKELPFSNVEELVKRADSLGIKYGAKSGGATHKFFKGSENELFQKIGKYMDAHPDLMFNNPEGVKRAAQGKYAFFMESSSIEYEISGSCNLTTVGNKLDEKHYGIAMKKGSPFRSRLSTAVLKLQERGILDKLKRKWWEDQRKKPECEGDELGSDAPPLNLKHVGGIFWVSIGGTVMAFVMVFSELSLHTLKKYGRDRQSCMAELKDEFKFYFTFKGMVKSVKDRKGDSQSQESKGSKEKLGTAESTPMSFGFMPEITQGIDNNNQ